MKSLKYKLLAVDMDGTLLDDDKNVTAENLKAIEKIKQMGVKFVICSGRIPGGLRFYMDKISKEQPIISCNGGIILDEKRDFIYYKPMSTDNALMLVDFLRDNGDPYYHFYDGDILCTERFDYGAANYHKFCLTIEREHRLEIRIVPDAKEYIKEHPDNIRKFVIMNSDLEFIEKLREKLLTESLIEITSSDASNIEVMESGISKGSGIKILAEHYGFSIEECIAIGNDQNDVSMIEAAGLGVAMKNASQSIKDKADYVTVNDNNNDGIAEVINKFIIGE